MKKEGQSLRKITILKSELTGIIYIARFGKNPNIALDKRPLTESEIKSCESIFNPRSTN